MSALFCRRLRMQVDLRKYPAIEPQLPDGYRWTVWSPELLDRHANVKFRCFAEDQDGRVFQSLREEYGCRQLMEFISQHEQFMPTATWLLTIDDLNSGESTDCGTVQGLAPTPILGAVQNLGVLPEHRGQGLGRAIMQKGLLGFQNAGLQFVTLEVTDGNHTAIALYESLGFELQKTLFRRVEV